MKNKEKEENSDHGICTTECFGFVFFLILKHFDQFGGGEGGLVCFFLPETG